MTPLVPALLFSGLATAPPPDNPPARETAAYRDLQRLQGVWQFESLEEGGVKIPAADVKARTLFFGGNVFLVRRETAVVQAGYLSLNPTKSPKTVNVLVQS